MGFSVQRLTAIQADALREIANIGAGNAITALAEMTAESFQMTIPAVEVCTLSGVPQPFEDPEALTAAVYMPVDGDAPGHAAFLFPYRCACELADLLLCRPRGATRDLGEMECSALTEVGNILASSFLNAISDMTGLNLPASPPGIAVDMSTAILASLLATTPTLDDQAMTITTRLVDVSQPVEGVFLFMPEPNALPVLFGALGVEG